MTSLISSLPVSSQFNFLTNEFTPTEISYKSGARFIGYFENFKKSGPGLLTWPDNCKYEGEFNNSKKSGKGKETWQDSSEYTGEYLDDLKHGHGTYKWPNGESYTGHFFKDYRHGYGKYTWSNGSYYEGGFYMNQRHGYGILKCINGDMFQGVYKHDKRFGPGVYTYHSGNQDVGLWDGDKLIKSCLNFPKSFNYLEHTKFACLPFERNNSLEDIATSLLSFTNIRAMLTAGGVMNYIQNCVNDSALEDVFHENVHPNCLSVNRILFNDAFFKNVNEHDGHTAEDVDVSSTDALTQVNEEISCENDESKQNDDQKCSADISGVGDTYISSNTNDTNKSVDTSKITSSKALSTSSQHYSHEMTVNAAKSVPESPEESAKAVKEIFNQTPLIFNMIKHTARLKSKGCIPNFDIEDVISNRRDSFGPEGLQESLSMKFLNAAMIGDIKVVEDMLLTKQVHPDVSDMNGTTALIMASVFCHTDVINCLLNYGADINKVNDQRCSAVVASFIQYYSISSFRWNIAETYLGSEADWNELVASCMKPPKPAGSDDADHEGKEDNIDDIEVESDGNEESDDDFESNKSLKYFKINISKKLLEQCASYFSVHTDVSETLRLHNEGLVRHMALDKINRAKAKSVLDLLIKRNADLNVSSVPMSVLFFAVKSADVEMVRLLLTKGASPLQTLSDKKGGLTPLHIAVAIRGPEGVKMTELLLDALADPNAQALEDDSYIDENKSEDGTTDVTSQDYAIMSGGRTPLHIVCERTDNQKESQAIVDLLLYHKANPKLLCNGYSPMAIALARGNDLVVDKLLDHGADPNQTLPHPVGSALCVMFDTKNESQWNIDHRVKMIDKLVVAGADILAPISIGPKKTMGTAVDFAHYSCDKDRRIAHMPYHSLNPVERDTFNNRKKLLGHIGGVVRKKTSENEVKAASNERGDDPQSTVPAISVTSAKEPQNCNYCGKSAFVHLSPCPRCKQVYYCCKGCRTTAWNEYHKDDCISKVEPGKKPSTEKVSPAHPGSKGDPSKDKSMKSDKSNKSRKVDKNEVTDKQEKFQQSEKSNKQRKPEDSDKTGKMHQPGRSNKPGKDGDSNKPGKLGDREKTDKTVKHGDSTKIDKPGKVSKPGEVNKLENNVKFEGAKDATSKRQSYEKPSAAFQTKFPAKLALCYRNPKCQTDHKEFFKNQSAVCLQQSLDIYIDNYSYV